MSRIRQMINLNILKHYALATTVLFVLLATYAVFLFTQHGFFESMHLSLMQKLSTIVFFAVLGSSLFGTVFHQLINYQPRSRNAFAFVFSVSTLKFVGTLLAFQVFGF